MIWLETLGYTGQALFAGRVLLQWIASEREGRSLVPRWYWEVSLAASAMVLTYAFLKNNFVFVLSTLPGAIIASRNMRIVKPATRRQLVPWAGLLVAVLAWTAVAKPHFGPPLWATIGLVGSFLWGGRHLLQWWVSERRGESTLPGAFWVLSLVGSLLLVSYAVSRGSGVMIVGYAFGCIPYLRNLVLLRRAALITALAMLCVLTACHKTSPVICNPPASFPAGIELGPQLAQAAQTSVIVAWRSTEPVTGGIAIDGRRFSDTRGVEHTFLVTGLAPGTTYTYRLEHDGAPLDGEYTLRTPNAGPFRFAVLGDSGSGCEAQFDVAAVLDAQAPDLILHTGDVAYLSGSYDDFRSRYFVPYADLLSRIPFYLTVGDHDVHTDDGATMLSLVHLPGNERYYSFDRDGCHFVALDTNLDLGAGSEQRAWLEADLAAAADARWTIAVFHHPPYSAGRHGDIRRVKRDLVPVLDAHKVDLAFSGNDHSYERTHPLRAGGVDPEGTTYIVTGGGGQTLYRVGQSRFTAFSSSVFHAVVVDVSDTALVLRAVHRNGTVFDTHTISAD